MSVDSTVMENVLIQLAKTVLVPFGLIEVASATDTAIQKKIFGLRTTALINLKEEIKNILQISQSLE